MLIILISTVKLFIYFILFFIISEDSFTQNFPNNIIKYDVGGAWSDEFRVTFERKIWRYRTKKLKDPLDDLKLRGSKRFMSLNLNKFYYFSLSYFYKHYQADKEAVTGPVLRAGIRHYFPNRKRNTNKPERFHINLGMQYGFIRASHYSEGNLLTDRLFTHRFGGHFLTGYQFLLSRKDELALDFFVGGEYHYYLKNHSIESNYFPVNTFPVVLLIGAQVGIAVFKPPARMQQQQYHRNIRDYW